MAKLSTFLLAASVSLAGFAVPAAASEDELPRVVVHYGDLDMSSIAGRKRLSMRVAGAVKQVCGSEAQRDLRRQAQSRACRVQAMQKVERELASVVNGHGVELADRDGTRPSAP